MGAWAAFCGRVILDRHCVSLRGRLHFEGLECMDVWHGMYFEGHDALTCHCGW